MVSRIAVIQIADAFEEAGRVVWVGRVVVQEYVAEELRKHLMDSLRAVKGNRSYRDTIEAVERELRERGAL